ncbi:MAG: orotidine-5'-phosphate decarboxylase [Parasphingorhabdus sp.]|jgi:orotidine-5'-phosphate decarboxylase
MHDRNSILAEQRLIVPLDVPEIDQAKAMVESLGNNVVFYKIGLELFMSRGFFELLDWLRDRQKLVFVDLKFFDIPATVARAVSRLNGTGVTFTTVHGNDSMMAAAAEAAKDVSVLAVTVLTSIDRGDLDDLGFQCNVDELVMSRAKRAVEHGCAGVVASGQEAKPMREALGDRLLIVSPGIRPIDNRGDDQKRVVTVEQAFDYGADYIVVGRPIRDAEDPAAAAAAIQKQIKASV